MDGPLVRKSGGRPVSQFYGTVKWNRRASLIRKNQEKTRNNQKKSEKIGKEWKKFRRQKSLRM